MNKERFFVYESNKYRINGLKKKRNWTLVKNEKEKKGIRIIYGIVNIKTNWSVTQDN